ncbi:MAG: hypothetical protein QXD25_01140 [Nanopusillaceae archaeon]
MKWLKIKYSAYTLPDNRIIDFSKDYVIIPIGKNLFPKEIEDTLKDAEIGKNYSILLKKPYGERSESNIKILPKTEFLKRNINPIPGLVVLVDGVRGIVRSVNGGRIIVDFNHPFAGKDIIYSIDVLEEVKDLSDKIKGIINFIFRIDFENIDIIILNNDIKIKLKGEKLPENFIEILKNYIEDLKDYNITLS